ncbi:MAG: metallopeptidase family protein [Thermodesulfovibrionales bacterium]
MSFRISREDFERLAEKALETLPGEYRKYFTNITITVEDYPSNEDAGRVNARRENLLGLFSGVPHPRKGGFFEIPYPLPDRIILFQRNIESICSSEKELIEQIQKTLIHEVGHYFGLSERDLRRHGV